jgi:hypothetical protein
MTRAAVECVWHFGTCATCDHNVMWNDDLRPDICPFDGVDLGTPRHTFVLKPNPRFKRGFWKFYFKAGKWAFDYGTKGGIRITWLRRSVGWIEGRGWFWERHNKWGN